MESAIVTIVSLFVNLSIGIVALHLIVGLLEGENKGHSLQNSALLYTVPSLSSSFLFWLVFEVIFVRFRLPVASVPVGYGVVFLISLGIAFYLVKYLYRLSLGRAVALLIALIAISFAVGLVASMILRLILPFLMQIT